MADEAASKHKDSFHMCLFIRVHYQLNKYTEVV